MWPHRWQPTRLPCPWDSPGKNTGVGSNYTSPSQSIVLRAAASAPPGHLLETKFLRPHTGPVESQTLEWAHFIQPVKTGSPYHSDACWSLRATELPHQAIGDLSDVHTMWREKGKKIFFSYYYYWYNRLGDTFLRSVLFLEFWIFYWTVKINCWTPNIW